jgi:hypothetical protein
MTRTHVAAAVLLALSTLAFGISGQMVTDQAPRPLLTSSPVSGLQ